MSEPAWDEKAFLRAEKYGEALQAEIEATHFACWRLELKRPELYPAIDDDGPPVAEPPDDPEDGPPPGWIATRLN